MSARAEYPAYGVALKRKEELRRSGRPEPEPEPPSAAAAPAQPTTPAGWEPWPVPTRDLPVLAWAAGMVDDAYQAWRMVELMCETTADEYNEYGMRDEEEGARGHAQLAGRRAEGLAHAAYLLELRMVHVEEQHEAANRELTTACMRDRGNMPEPGPMYRRNGAPNRPGGDEWAMRRRTALEHKTALIEADKRQQAAA